MSQTVSQDPDDEQFARDLRTLRTRLPDLRQLAAKKASVMARQSRGGQYTVAPIPLNEGAWTLLEDIKRYARSLGRAVGVRQRHVPTEGLLVAAIDHRERLLARTDADSIKRVDRTAVQRMDRQFEPPEDRTLIGYCDRCGAEQWCVQDDLESGWTVCPSCHATLKVRDIQQARILRLAASGAQGTAASLASLFSSCGIPVRRQTIAQWKFRGIVDPISLQGGKPAYMLWDIWQALNRDI